MNRKIRVIAGPHRVARRYAASMGWADSDFIIVTRGHQIASLDPNLILNIVTVRLHVLGGKIMDEINVEIDRVRTLWPVPTVAAA